MSMAECTRCRLDRRLLRLLTPPHGTIPPGLDKLREGLVRAGRPDHMMDWLNNPGVCPVLQAVAARGATTHEALDALPPGGTRDHVRTMMVATGVLPARDERITALEHWISQAAGELADPVHRQVLHGYAVWHRLRRLRGRLDCRAASRGQAKSVQHNVTAAAALIRWLEERGLTLAACTQAGHDQWMTGDSGHRARSAGFVRWAVRHRHASVLTAPAVRWPGPAGPLDQDRRWTDARRLLHDEGTGLANRVAGLLVLLYAQRLSDITALTTRHLQREGSRTSLLLGSRPVTLPPRSTASSPVSRTTGAHPARACPPAQPTGCSPVAGRGRRWPGTRSAGGSTPSGSARGRPAAPPCSPWPPRSRPRSWRRCSASTSRQPSSIRRSPPATGPPTPPTSAAGPRRGPFRHVTKRQSARDHPAGLPGLRQPDPSPRPPAWRAQGQVLLRSLQGEGIPRPPAGRQHRKRTRRRSPPRPGTPVPSRSGSSSPS